VVLTDNQHDALTELINIGYGRAAGALSELTGYRVTLEVPQVTMHEIEKLTPMLEKIISIDVASVNQGFTGPVSGNALLILDVVSALTLTQVLTDERAVSREFDSNAREVITEVGNILLNACLGVFGNLLEVRVNFAVPVFQKNSVKQVLQPFITDPGERIQYGLMVHTRFHLKTGDVMGYLVIILGVTSLDRLLLELKNWEERQTK
jgi:chemotaxis protein CheC